MTPDSLFPDVPVIERGVPYERVLTEWNAMAEAAGLPTVRALTPKRRAKLRVRWSEPAFRRGWPAILRIIPGQGWMCGRTPRRWRATLDYVIRSPDTYIRILEQPDPAAAPPPKHLREDAARAAEARAARGQ